MSGIDPIYVGDDAVGELVAYCRARPEQPYALVADTRTYRALGERVEAGMRAAGFAVTPILLQGDEIAADERSLVQVLVHAPLGECVFLAIGSGTITDITRFISHRTGRSFIALPTAPSVDGFTSVGAPIVLNGVKQTLLAHAPIALFADLPTLCQAPPALIAAGFGDIVGKVTALADWQLGALLWDEPYDAAVAARVRQTMTQCLGAGASIAARTPESIRLLMEALIEVGLCMLAVAHSRPASGAEHHVSHYWEMVLLQQGRPAILHGAKVGAATSLIAAQYAGIRALSREELSERLEAAVLPDEADEIARIQRGFGGLADDIAREHAAFLDMGEARFEQLRQRIWERWSEIQAAAETVLAPEAIRSLLETVGAPAQPAALGLSDAEVTAGLTYAEYVRNRFTVLKLNRVLGISVE